MRVSSTFMSCSNENKSCMRVSDETRSRACHGPWSNENARELTGFHSRMQRNPRQSTLTLVLPMSMRVMAQNFYSLANLIVILDKFLISQIIFISFTFSCSLIPIRCISLSELVIKQRLILLLHLRLHVRHGIYPSYSPQVLLLTHRQLLVLQVWVRFDKRGQVDGFSKTSWRLRVDLFGLGSIRGRGLL